MTVTDFFNKLDNVAHSYHWDVTSNNKVVATIRSGPNKGFTLNPITALAQEMKTLLFCSQPSKTTLSRTGLHPP